ncbi:Protein TIC 20 [Psidium guajava]|nr:Protein TIC 20 [Psidium guajava]KAI3439199.1 Protein TIC 20 [Psidium guajava]
MADVSNDVTMTTAESCRSFKCAHGALAGACGRVKLSSAVRLGWLDSLSDGESVGDLYIVKIGSRLFRKLTYGTASTGNAVEDSLKLQAVEHRCSDKALEDLQAAECIKLDRRTLHETNVWGSSPKNWVNFGMMQHVWIAELQHVYG